MCSAPKVSMPEMPEYDPPEPIKLPPPPPPVELPKEPEKTPDQVRQETIQNSLPIPRVENYKPVAPPMPTYKAPPMAPPAPQVTPQLRQAPPPQLTNTSEESAIVKRRKSKRKELQQAAGGTDALRIKLDGSSIGGAKKGTGSTGLNIPK